MEAPLTVHFHFNAKFVLVPACPIHSTFNMMAYRDITDRCVIMLSKIYVHNHAIMFVKNRLKSAPEATTEHLHFKILPGEDATGPPYHTLLAPTALDTQGLTNV